MGAGIGLGTTGLGVGLDGVTGAGAGLGSVVGAGAGKGSPGAGKGSGLPCWATSNVVAAKVNTGMDIRVSFILSSAVILFLFLSVFAIYQLAVLPT
jgi:hypothetical protein